MGKHHLIKKLAELCKLPHETEWLEFKSAETTHDFKKLGKYFSAMAKKRILKGSLVAGWYLALIKTTRFVGAGIEKTQQNWMV